MSDYGSHMAEDRKHFVYCPDEPGGVYLDVVAEFSTNTCTQRCAHTDRSVTWDVPGTAFTVVSSDTSMAWNGNFAAARFHLPDTVAGDVVNVTCDIGDAGQLACEEKRRGGYYEHTGGDGGASGTCTVKYWRLDLDVTGADAEEVSSTPQEFWTTFAGNATTTVEAIGATPVATGGGVYAFIWESYLSGSGSPYAAKLGSTSWTGRIVASTHIEVEATVVNGCDSNFTSGEIADLYIEPVLRRSGWDTTTTSDIPKSSIYQSDESKFPGLGGSFLWGINTNSNATFAASIEDAANIVTPIYHDYATYPFYYSDFDNVVAEVSSGPNTELWYNASSAIFSCDRVAKINYWISSGAGKPAAAPSAGPTGTGITSYSNYHDLYVQSSNDKCGCANPSAHDGTGGNYRYRSTVWHETIGCPDSDNQPILGHHVLMTDAILDDPDEFDPVWQADLRWAEDKESLRTIDENIQKDTSLGLAGEMARVHSSINSFVELHNFFGSNWVVNGSSWSSQPGPYYGGW